MGLRTWIIIAIVWSIPAALIIIRTIQIRRRRKHWRSNDAAFAADIRDRVRKGQL
jgi:hypothetical protein